MNQVKTVIFILLLSVGFGFSTSQSDCSVLFKEAFDKLKNLNAKPGKGLDIKYSVTVKSADGNSYTDQVTLTIQNKKAKIISSDAIIFQDDKAMVAIRSVSNTIFIAHPVTETLRKLQLGSMTSLQDSVFKHLRQKSCLIEAETKYRKFSFETTENDNMGIASLVYWIDPSEVLIKKVLMTYSDSNENRLRSVFVEFDAMNNNYTGSPFEGSAVGKVFNSKKQLLPSYKNYSLIDNR